MDTSRDNGQKGKESPHIEFLHDNDQKKAFIGMKFQL